jgi:hypothetical protein
MPAEIHDRPDALAAARAVAAELFPDALWVVLAGGVLSAARTAGSDLDIVVCRPDNPDPPYRQSLRRHRWPVELFVHDPLTLEHYLAKDLDARRPALNRMLATGSVVGGDAELAAPTLRRCAEVMAEGPPPLPDADLDRLRYAVTDLLDDLTHGRDPAETVAIVAALWTSTAELALHVGRHWLGGGKWLLRELRDLDPDLAARWVGAHGDPRAAAALAADVLATAGGPLFEGYRAVGERPTSPADP